jgi:hypothetical protein
VDTERKIQEARLEAERRRMEDEKRKQQIDLGSMLWTRRIFGDFRQFFPRQKCHLFSEIMLWSILSKKKLFSPIFWRKYFQNHNVGPRPVTRAGRWRRTWGWSSWRRPRGGSMTTRDDAMTIFPDFFYT